MENYFSITITLTFAIAALMILVYDRSFRRRIMKERLKYEKQLREEWEYWLDGRVQIIKNLSEYLSKGIAGALGDDCRWAAGALERARLGPYADTLFGERMNHFREEKEYLAEKFTPILLERCQYIINNSNDKKVVLLIDSGTTLLPLFAYIGKQTVEARIRGEKWINGLIIVTNSLTGVESLCENGRVFPKYRYSNLAVTCNILPGNPMPIYSAVAGGETDKAIEALNSKPSENTVFVCVTTGNWVRVSEVEQDKRIVRCPILLARGPEHVRVKQAMINVSEEVFVIAPLGKIFANASMDGINKILRCDKHSNHPDRLPYADVSFDTKKAERIKLISTRREENRILHRLSTYLEGELHAHVECDEESFKKNPIHEISHILFAYDKLPDSVPQQLEIEYPHRHTQHKEFYEFHQNPNKQN